MLPEQHGLLTTRRRLVPGLSRDETATLADIGSSWYARLEAGRVDHPTLETMLGIARALRLNIAETTYVLKLAGLVPPAHEDAGAGAGLSSIAALFGDGDAIGFSLWDRYLFPIGWNAVADAMHGFSDHEDPIRRHPVVHLDDPKVVAFFGEAHESYARNLVGMFRRAYVAGEPSPLAQAVYALAQDISIFRKYWEQHVVADHVTDPEVPFTRNHWIVGKFSALANDLMMNDEQIVLRVVAPADAESRIKFKHLRSLGHSFSPMTPPAVDALLAPAVLAQRRRS